MIYFVHHDPLWHDATLPPASFDPLPKIDRESHDDCEQPMVCHDFFHEQKAHVMNDHGIEHLKDVAHIGYGSVDYDHVPMGHVGFDFGLMALDVLKDAVVWLALSDVLVARGVRDFAEVHAAEFHAVAV
jgi:hypothetical protein